MVKMRKFERGAVSIFVVIISALLITTITVAFIRLMIQDQQQAQANDLSKSALDSAYAGVEDAKRALVQYRTECPSGPDTSNACQNLALLMNGSDCTSLQTMGISGVSGTREVILKQNEDDTLLEQAYTCVKVQLNTIDYVASLTPNVSRMVPLRGTEAFDRIEIEWFSQADLQDANSGPSIDLPLDASLPRLTDWPKNRPALMRLQMIQFAGSFNLSDFETSTNNASLFLKPSTIDGTGGSLNFADNTRLSQSGKAQPVLIACNRNFSTTSVGSPYACKASISMPNPAGATNGDNRTAYLRIGQIYNTNTSFRLTLWSGADSVTFNNVQPAVDSTGRANDLFRRINARIDLGGSGIPMVESAVDISGSLCKNFLVTDTIYNQLGSCQP